MFSTSHGLRFRSPWIPTRRGQTDPWRPAELRGFIKLWQFRIGGPGAASGPLPQGPQFRDARLARVEAALFLSRRPLNSRKIAQLADLAGGNEARTLIRRLQRLLHAAGSPLEVAEVAGGYQLLTRPEFSPWLRRLLAVPGATRLSAPAMETLAVVAYRQPILRAEIEAIRGVQCDDILRQLLDRDLLRIIGRSEDLGRPLLYGTTKRFLELFGLRDLDELPRSTTLRRIGGLADEGEHPTSDSNPGTSRVEEIAKTETTSEERSVTTRIRSALVRDELNEGTPLGLVDESRRHLTVHPSRAAKDEEEEDEDLDEEEDEEDEEWDEEEDEEDDEDFDDDFVDEEWEEVEDDEEDSDEEDEDDEEWDEDEDEDWDEDEDEEGDDEE